jgi:hypothetical protein
MDNCVSWLCYLRWKKPSRSGKIFWISPFYRRFIQAWHVLQNRAILQHVPHHYISYRSEQSALAPKNIAIWWPFLIDQVVHALPLLHACRTRNGCEIGVWNLLITCLRLIITHAFVVLPDLHKVMSRLMLSRVPGYCSCLCVAINIINIIHSPSSIFATTLVVATPSLHFPCQLWPSSWCDCHPCWLLPSTAIVISTCCPHHFCCRCCLPSPPSTAAAVHPCCPLPLPSSTCCNIVQISLTLLIKKSTNQWHPWCSLTMSKPWYRTNAASHKWSGSWSPSFPPHCHCPVLFVMSLLVVILSTSHPLYRQGVAYNNCLSRTQKSSNQNL